jgi:hypothetical protein
MKRILAAILAFFMGSSCKPAPPPPQKITTPVFVAIGGIGKSQMKPVIDAVHAAFPGMVAFDFAPKDAYLGDVGEWLIKNSTGDVVLCGHSKGASACVKAARTLMQNGRRVLLMVLMDSVGDGESELEIPANVVKCICYTAGIPTPFIFRASIKGKHTERVLPWVLHNAVPSAAKDDVILELWGVL